MDNVTIIRVVIGAFFLFIFMPAYIVAYWKIFTKAGFSGWPALLMLIPVVNLVILLIVAFSEWKTIPKPNTLG